MSRTTEPELLESGHRYATCLGCAHAITWLENQQLRFAMPCPACGAEKKFGPGVFIEDFEGYTMDEVIQIKAARR